VTTRLTLISHADTAAVREARFPSDEPLDERGHRRAAAAAGAVRSDRPGRHGGTLRTRQTAEALGLAAVPDPGLRDLDVGRWRGRRLEELPEEEVHAWLADPAAAPHGGESVCHLLGRVGDWLDRCLDDGGAVVAVTHPAVIRAALVTALRMPPAMFWRIDVPPLSTTLMHGRAGAWTLRHACLPLGPALRR
jgi:broad specificity phosphatase PhoE